MPLQLSLVIPAYNERLRLPPFLARVRHYLDSRFPGAYEVIVVDDGSTDGLAEVLADPYHDWAEGRLLRHPVNRGKGAAIRTGLLAAEGELLLFADADGATPIEEEQKLRQAIYDGADIAVGSRFVRDATSGSWRRWHRGVAGRAFGLFARALLGLPVWDTQCGFKMFRWEPGRRLAKACREERYLLDLEILARAHYLHYTIVEIPVSWTEMPGSKVSLLADGWRMLHGLRQLRRTLNAERRQGPERMEASLPSRGG